jgi:hypothetical protein
MENRIESFAEFLERIETTSETPDDGHLSQEQLRQLIIRLGEIAGSDLGGR